MNTPSKSPLSSVNTLPEIELCWRASYVYEQLLWLLLSKSIGSHDSSSSQCSLNISPRATNDIRKKVH